MKKSAQKSVNLAYKVGTCQETVGQNILNYTINQQHLPFYQEQFETKKHLTKTQKYENSMENETYYDKEVACSLT